MKHKHLKVERRALSSVWLVWNLRQDRSHRVDSRACRTLHPLGIHMVLGILPPGAGVRVLTVPRQVLLQLK